MNEGIFLREGKKALKFVKIELKVQNLCTPSDFPKPSRLQEFSGLILAPGLYVRYLCSKE